ncbi:hypothetical protein RclHR1_05790012 [Rhizophagus clarus]|uniref:Uncharacterized protein n=1 Tax=Rhizophagus clarus TaxID=94130 RepID=A0A2Z6RQR1_9GLOM|nr:hypothetical protein RclHR1_05790012 [Rhizophagus clarus]
MTVFEIPIEVLRQLLVLGFMYISHTTILFQIAEDFRWHASRIYPTTNEYQENIQRIDELIRAHYGNRALSEILSDNEITETILSRCNIERAEITGSLIGAVRAELYTGRRLENNTRICIHFNAPAMSMVVTGGKSKLHLFDISEYD